METDLSLVIALAITALATVTVMWRWTWHQPLPQPPALRRPYDDEPHALTLLGKDGRANPLSTQIYPSYPVALLRQRHLGDLGQASQITHLDSGEVRVDYATLVGPLGRLVS